MPNPGHPATCRFCYAAPTVARGAFCGARCARLWLGISLDEREADEVAAWRYIATGIGHPVYRGAAGSPSS